MMGLVVNLDEWKVYDNKPGPADQPVWKSNVRCTNFDTDLLTCEADDLNDHSCDHRSDVYVKCREPTWAGKTRGV
jgi:Scavenger receptor cysteine-rich domain